MTEQETARLLLVIAARYPTSKAVHEDESLRVKAWHMTLADVAYADAERALVQWFKTERWAPDPSELRNRVATDVLDLPEIDDAWARVKTAIAIYYPGFGNSYQLPEPVRRAVNAIGGIHMLKMSENSGKDREAFARAYAVERKREIETAILDPTLLDGPAFRVLG